MRQRDVRVEAKEKARAQGKPHKDWDTIEKDWDTIETAAWPTKRIILTRYTVPIFRSAN